MQIIPVDLRLQQCCPVNVGLSRHMVLVLKIQLSYPQIYFHLEVRWIDSGPNTHCTYTYMYMELLQNVHCTLTFVQSPLVFHTRAPHSLSSFVLLPKSLKDTDGFEWPVKRVLQLNGTCTYPRTSVYLFLI